MEIKNKAWQVAELEESKNNLLLENQQLRENVLGLHSTVQNLENSSSSSASQGTSAKVCAIFMFKIYNTYSFIEKWIFLKSLKEGKKDIDSFIWLERDFILLLVKCVHDLKQGGRRRTFLSLHFMLPLTIFCLIWTGRCFWKWRV